MSIQSQIDRLVQAKADLIAQIEAKGVTVPADASLDDLAALVEAISTGSDPVLQAKTVTPTTSQQNVTPDSGYDGLSKVTVNAMPTATQATPSIEVSTAGLITAKTTQSAGYVAAGTKQATKQLTTQGAQTITPGTANKTIASGRYLTGTQTIKGDANLKAENIAEGVSIFGVAGTHSGGSGGGGAVETCTGRVSYDDLLNYRNPAKPVTYYTAGNLSVLSFNASGDSTEITAVKGSLLYMSCAGSIDAVENATVLSSTSAGVLFSIEADEFKIIVINQ